MSGVGLGEGMDRRWVTLVEAREAEGGTEARLARWTQAGSHDEQ